MHLGTIALVVSIGVGSVLAPHWMPPAVGQDAQATRRAEVDEILSHMTMVTLDDGKGHKVKTLRITGINVQIVNGTEVTSGERGLGNGVGNLIVGYNEIGNPGGDDRSGSHNIVVGQMNSYSSSGGFLAGRSNTASGTFATVVGGTLNRASGTASSIVGGDRNVASGTAASVLGGEGNEASGSCSSVHGKKGNVAKETDEALPQ